jgi:hypothetical protein
MKKIILPHSKQFAETLFSLNEAIGRYYENNSFKFVNIEDQFILFSTLSLFSLKMYNIQLDQVPLSEYIKGLKEGYSKNIIPFVDAPEARKELILRIVLHSNSSFAVSRRENKTYFISDQNSYLHGLMIGEKYKAWSHIFETPDIYSKTFERIYAKAGEELPQLKDIFSDSQNLEKLVELLIEKKYVSNEAGRLTWTGIEHETARGRGYQMIALSEVCRPLYVKKEYQAKELHSAWTSYFNFDIAVNNWQPSLKHKISDSYFKLFSFVRHSLKFN